MLNKEYFEDALNNSQRDIGHDGAVLVVRMFLHGGFDYLVKEVIAAEDGYVVLRVYPPQLADVKNADDVHRELKYRTDKDEKTHFDIVSVGYGNINHIFMSRRPPDGNLLIGFVK